MAKIKVFSNPVIAQLVDRMVRAGNPDLITLFGSRARGTSQIGSDYDFLVIKDVPNDSRRAYRRIICRSLFGSGVSKDVIVATPDDIMRFGDVVGTVLKPALDEGVVVYDRATSSETHRPRISDLSN